MRPIESFILTRNPKPNKRRDMIFSYNKILVVLRHSKKGLDGGEWLIESGGGELKHREVGAPFPLELRSLLGVLLFFLGFKEGKLLCWSKVVVLSSSTLESSLKTTPRSYLFLPSSGFPGGVLRSLLAQFREMTISRGDLELR